MSRTLAACAVLTFMLAGCRNGAGDRAAESPVHTLGSIEVTARLTEVPEGAIFRRDLYDYATILRYEVTAVHRGSVQPGAILHVAQYNPWKARAEAADKRAPGIGGSLREFRGGDSHRMALEPDMDEHFMGGVVDKYFGKRAGPACWAVWTDAAD